MTSVLIHDQETIFPDHGKFLPERWLQPSNSRLQKYLLTFGKGSRQCAGMKLRIPFISFPSFLLSLSLIENSLY